MTVKKNLFISGLALATLSVSASAAVIATTNFDGRTLPSTNTADNLNWTVNGVDDPGTMSAFNATPAAQAIFNGNALVQNMFVPGINVGNGDTFWTTTVDLTVTTGFTVTLTDVTFDNWSINGGQSQNVNRQNDFTVTITSPTAVVLDSVDIVDSLSGTGIGVPNVTATFSAPVALTDPGTYTLEIKGGDFLGFNETGNHTGIDNLSINGTVVPEPSSALLAGLGLLAAFTRRRR